MCTNRLTCVAEDTSPTPEDQQHEEAEPAGEQDQFQFWSLQLCIFFDKFFNAADHLETVKRVQQKKG